MREALASIRPDVIHTHGYRADIQGGGVARALRIPTVTTVHGFTGGGWKNRAYELLQRKAFRRFDAVVAVSRPLGRALAAGGVAASRIHVIPNAAPVDRAPLDRSAARRELGLQSDGFVLGWVGRLSLEKGPDILVEALVELPGDITAVVIGKGRAEPMLRRLAAERGVTERIRWRGLVPDAGRLFAGFDCFVLSSRTEGTPIVLFEAMAAGAPIVATAVGGVPDVVSSREAVLVSPPDPAALAAGIIRVYADPRSASDRAAAARQRLGEERRVEPWVEQYDAVYRHLLASPS
jgi:glycosyltransferase involved in cell wall biosynthesis